MSDAASRAYGLSRETKGSVALRRAPVDVPRPRWWVIFLLRILLGLYLPRAYNLVVRGDRQAMKRRGPFILVGNHQNFWDPFLVGLHMREVPQFVTSDNIFRGGFFSRVMTGVGSIPISKYMRNSDTIRMISGVLKRGGVVGMYPESDRTYDGRSLPVRPEVVKLIRMMRVPVIGVHQRGGFLSGPKWGPHRRRGRLELRYELLYDPEKEGDVALEVLLERVRGVIEHDEMRAQRTDPVAFRSTRPAEGLERFLYACPVCGEFQTHVTEGDSMRCSACGHTTRMDEFGLLHPSTVPDRQEWDLLETWSAAQSKLLRQRIAEADAETAVFTQRVELSTGFRTRTLQSQGAAEVVCHGHGITIQTSSQRLSFAFSDIEGATVQNKEQFEFYHQRVLYRFGHTAERQSGYIWYDAVRQACGEA